MNETFEKKLTFLGLKLLSSEYTNVLNKARKTKISYHRFLTNIIEREYEYKVEYKRLTRIKAAKIPELLVMETFPFNLQKRLRKKLIMELYDSMRYMDDSQALLFLGPTGCGKTGLATAFLINAINQGYRGLFIDFNTLMRQLFQSIADHSERKTIKRLASIDCLLIDEVGYSTLNKEKSGLFFELIKLRHKKTCTIITSQHGFDEWDEFINDAHMTAALIDRITENCTVFNMTKCISIRNKNILWAADKK